MVCGRCAPQSLCGRASLEKLLCPQAAVSIKKCLTTHLSSTNALIFRDCFHAMLFLGGKKRFGGKARAHTSRLRNKARRDPVETKSLWEQVALPALRIGSFP